MQQLSSLEGALSFARTTSYPEDLFLSARDSARPNDISRHERAHFVALECAFRRFIEKGRRWKEIGSRPRVEAKEPYSERYASRQSLLWRTSVVRTDTVKRKVLEQTSPLQRGQGGLIKELAPTLLSRQTRADTRLPGDICGRSLFLGGTAWPFIYNDNDKRNDNSRLYVFPASTATVAAATAVAAITRDVVFMKRDKNSKRDPINRETRPRGKYAAHVPTTRFYLRKMRKKGGGGTGEERKAIAGMARVVEFFAAHVCPTARGKDLR